MSLPSLLSHAADLSRRRAVLFILAWLALAGVAGVISAQRLGVSTDTDKLFAASLPWRQRQMAMDHAFPQFRDLIVAVVDGATPEAADQTAADLAAALEADRSHFRSVTRPDASPYLETNGLLFLDEKPLGDLLDRTIDAQPFLGQLVADPSARGLFAAMTLLAVGVERGQADLTPYAASLEAFHNALQGTLAGHPAPLSWQRLLGGNLSEQAGPYRFIIAHPALDYGALQPGGAATDQLREIASKLEFVRNGMAHVRVTGSVALADEEFATVAQGALAGTIGSILLVIVWLILAVRSWRMIVPIVLTLLLGLVLTTGFAAAAVGKLNLISLAFAVLFVGIAVDFAIQFSVRFRELSLHEGGPDHAFAATGRQVGPQILVAAAAIAAGFLAFVPTDFTGVAELGMIAGAGMVFAFLCTLLFLPAALALMHPRAEHAEIGFRWGDAVDRRLLRVRAPLLAAFGVLALLGAFCVSRLTFDSDPLHTKDPTTEAMRTLTDLLNSPLTNPYTADMLAPSVEAADALAAKLKALPLVGNVLTLSSFVPKDQPPKLARVEDAANVLGATLAPSSPPAPVTPADLRLAAKTAYAQIQRAEAKTKLLPALEAIGGDLRTLIDAPDATLTAANQALTRFLPMQIDRLRHLLQASAVSAADVPPDIARDWRLPDGRVRVQAFARSQARDSAGLHAFVDAVRTVAPDAGGPAITIVETSGTITGAFRSAAISALIAIAAILAIVLRRLLDVSLVMAPLLLSALLTAVVAVGLPLSLNFANIIALPLLLGVGVSFNIYFVMNWRAGATRFLGTATARAILFSALTTGTAFGSLALSRHPGTASMGDLLLISLGCTLVATMFFVPAVLLGLRSTPR